MPSLVETEVDVSDLVHVLERFEAKGNNLRSVANEISVLLLEKVEDEFESEGGGKWPKLSDETLRRRRKSTSPKTLQDTGVMVGTLKATHGNDYAEVAAPAPYAKFHLNGTSNMPARDFFAGGPTEALSREIPALLLQRILDGSQ